MKKNLFLIFLVVILASQSVLFAANNPFMSKKSKKRIIKPVRYPVFVQKMLNKILPIQHKLNRKLADLIKKTESRESRKTIFILIFISFVFGIIHAMGPGHGKTLIFSYFLSKKATVLKGIIVGNIIAFMHAASALIIVLGIYLIVKKSYLSSFEDFSKIIKLISFGIISLVGLYLLINALLNLKIRNAKHEDETKDNLNKKNMFPIIIAIGMIPCPGAAIILLFSISMNVLKIGIVTVFFMALGMALTISSVGLLTILTKQSILKLFQRKNRLKNYFQTFTEILGASLILLIGIFLFLLNV